jgi:glycosyltransferase involved in cell wall biosynthesis
MAAGRSARKLLMRIVMAGDHPYPLPRVGVGRRPKRFPSAAGQRVHDWLAKGLGELGHEVLYRLSEPASGAVPPGVFVTRDLRDGDILHTYAMRSPEVVAEWRARGRPWVETCHVDPRSRGLSAEEIDDRWVFVSRTLAESCGRQRVVVNGIDPSEYIYSETKSDYVVFLSSMDAALAKGLDLALAAASRAGVPMIVAGTGTTGDSIEAARRLCAHYGATYLGDVQGAEKAELLAGAGALLLPTKVNDACPMVILEALISGTPVIASGNGACPELVTSDVGFICRSEEELAGAIGRMGGIAPAACRERALRDYHYLRMARDYVREYEAEICSQRRLSERHSIRPH